MAQPNTHLLPLQSESETAWFLSGRAHRAAYGPRRQRLVVCVTAGITALGCVDILARLGRSSSTTAILDGEILQRSSSLWVNLRQRDDRCEGAVNDFLLGRLGMDGSHCLYQLVGSDAWLDLRQEGLLDTWMPTH